MALSIGSQLLRHTSKRTSGRVALYSAGYLDYADFDRDLNCTLLALDNSIARRHQFTLPARIKENNLFPSEKMLAYMGIQELPTKKAKLHDWIKIIDNHLEQHFAEYLT